MLMSFALAAVLQDSDAERIMRKLASGRVSVDYSELPLLEFARQISQLSGENVVVTGLEEGEMPPITIKLTDVSLASILALVLTPHGLITQIEEGVIHIRKKSSEKVVLELFDVKDLVAPLLDFPGVDVNLASNQIGVSTQTAEPEATTPGLTEDVLVELVQAHTGGDTWESIEGTSIAGTGGGVLVVRQTKRNQKTIGAFLAKLRRLR